MLCLPPSISQGDAGMNLTDEFLEHYGIPGMKWGVRKDRRSGRRKSATEEASTLTDKELRKRVSRLEMEKRYVELTAKREGQNESTASRVTKKGAGVVSSIIGNAAKSAAQDYARSEFTKAIQKQAKKRAGG